MDNPAFEFLRQFKEVEPETEKLVLRQTAYKVNNQELLAIFENGISGKYGKVYSADPQTLTSWITAYLKTKNSDKNYLTTGLTPVSTPSWETIEWDKEANKCYNAFLSGVNESQFHPAVYDRMMLDGKIEFNAYLKHYEGPKNSSPADELLWRETMNAVGRAKQVVLKNIFTKYQINKFSCVYFIKE